jgi:Domain of unknown function DUF29
MAGDIAMIRQPTETLADLYLADETAWLDAMSELIREGRLAGLDYVHLLEYLEDMAKRDRKEVSSRLRILLMHVLKWIYQKDMRTTSWRSTVLTQQAELEEDLEGGVLRGHAEESLAAIYQKAVKYAAQETELSADSFPAECPWTLDQLMSADVLGD